MTRDRQSDLGLLKARRDELVDMISRTRAKIEAAEAAMEAAAQFRSDLRQRVWEQEIQPGLGSIAIDCDGYLHDIRLDAESVRQSDSSRLGARILAAIQEAEAQAGAEHKEGLERIFRHMATS